jgi:hypothetical protein
MKDDDWFQDQSNHFCEERTWGKIACLNSERRVVTTFFRFSPRAAHALKSWALATTPVRSVLRMGNRIYSKEAKDE